MPPSDGGGGTNVKLDAPPIQIAVNDLYPAFCAGAAPKFDAPPIQKAKYEV
jgi:hypothetical protein